MSNIITSLGNNVKLPVEGSAPATLESGTLAVSANTLYLGTSSNTSVIVGGSGLDTDDITEGATNKFLSGAGIVGVAEKSPPSDADNFPIADSDDNDLQKVVRLDELAISDIFATRYQPIAVSATVPANGALPEGKQVLVVNSTVGRELYVGDASNNPVPACGYRQYVATFSQTTTNPITFNVLKDTTGTASKTSARSGLGVYTLTSTDFTSTKYAVNVYDMSGSLIGTSGAASRVISATVNSTVLEIACFLSTNPTSPTPAEISSGSGLLFIEVRFYV